MPPIQFLVEKREAGQTIAAVLRKRFALTWSQAQRIVERGNVRVAGQMTKASDLRVKKGNRVWIAAGAVEMKTGTGPKARREAKPETPLTIKKSQPKKSEYTFTVDIIYSDDAIVVVNKPAGVTSSRSKEDVEEFGARAKRFLPKTLADALPAALGAPTQQIYPVHRLDRDTSGLIVFARTAAAARHLTVQFRKHTTDRVYLAFTRGTPPTKRIESVLVRDRGDGRRGSSTTAKAGKDGLRAVTIVKAVKTCGEFALVQCRLETGRTHQVRIHLGEAGFPLCGETVYDRPLHGARLPDTSGAKRPLLHAVRLGIQHPETEEFMTWEVDPPADFTVAKADQHTFQTATGFKAAE